MNLLHKVRLDRDETSSNFIARLMSFKSFIRPLRKSIQDEIRSTYTVRLPFVVKADVVLRKNSTFYLGWKASMTNILYVTLEAPDDKYGVVEDDIPMFTAA